MHTCSSPIQQTWDASFEFADPPQGLGFSMFLCLTKIAPPPPRRLEKKLHLVKFFSGWWFHSNCIKLVDNFPCIGHGILCCPSGMVGRRVNRLPTRSVGRGPIPMGWADSMCKLWVSIGYQRCCPLSCRSHLCFKTIYHPPRSVHRADGHRYL